MKDLHFANPSAIYLLVLIFLVVAFLGYAMSQRRKSLREFADSESLSSLLFLEKRTLMRYVSLVGVWFLASIALMEPEKHKPFPQITSDAQKEVIEEALLEASDPKKVLVKRRACDVIFLIDASASMEITDTRQNESRLSHAKEIVDEMISHLDGQNVAIYTFTSALTPVVPPTMDYFFARLLLKDVNVNFGDVAGTDLFEAIDLISKKHFMQDNGKQKVMVLLTDGGDTYLDSLGSQERSSQIKVLLSKMKAFKDQKARLYSIGLGSKEGSVIPNVEYEGKPVISSLDTQLLTEMSQEVHGQYFYANDYSTPAMVDSMIKVLKAENSYVEEEKEIHHQLDRTTVEKNAPMIVKKRLYQWPLGLALIFLGFELILPLWPVRRGAGL